MDNLGTFSTVWRVIKWPVIVAFALLLAAYAFYGTLILILAHELSPNK